MCAFLNFDIHSESRWEGFFESNSDAEADNGCETAVGDCGGDEDGNGLKARVCAMGDGGLDGDVGERDDGERAKCDWVFRVGHC